MSWTELSMKQDLVGLFDLLVLLDQVACKKSSWYLESDS